jgi:glycosyltransferase involved in cell wall biosynthesis
MKISVALCTYNGEKFIKEQLESILNQTVSVDEIIICDDNSKDKTVSICQEILSESGKEYKIIVNEASLGVSNNFLKALKMTTGDYIFTCDQDDVWLEKKVEIFISEAEKSNRLLYFSNGELVDSNNHSLNKTLWDSINLKFSEIEGCASPLETILKRSIVTGAAMCVSRKLIEKVDSIPENWLHDEWFSIIASVEKSITPINQMTFNYRQHQNNVVGAVSKDFKTKITNWFGGFNSISHFRNHMQKRSLDILCITKNTEFENLAKKYYDFWNGLLLLSNSSFFKKIYFIFKNLFNGNYFCYYTGIRGFLRDLLLCFSNL